MLGGLDRIDWKTLTHTYGTAEDVRGLLRDLGSDDEGVRVVFGGLKGHISWDDDAFAVNDPDIQRMSYDDDDAGNANAADG